jgi:hypothetical protein
MDSNLGPLILGQILTTRPRISTVNVPNIVYNANYILLVHSTANWTVQLDDTHPEENNNADDKKILHKILTKIQNYLQLSQMRAETKQCAKQTCPSQLY